MPKIHVDEQVMAELRDRAAGRTPNDVIRQLLGLWVEEPQAAEPGVYLVPHSPKEFPGGASELSKWLLEDLARRPEGENYVASPYYWRNVVPGSICLFHKDKMIVGEGKLVGGLMPYYGSEVSPQTGKLYAGVVHFDPDSIKVYERPISFSTAETLLGKPLSFQAIQRLTRKDYDRIKEASSE
jgi:hypothetical protein